MKCTSCHNGTLEPSFIDQQFRAHTCSACGGNWILIEDFVNWKEHHPTEAFTTSVQWSEQDSADTTTAMLCPMSGAIMRKFKITASTHHRIDYSAAVGGIWLDKGEWELLKAEGVAGMLNQIVTQQWQHKIRQQSTSDSFEQIYQAKFGQETYDQIKSIREWLDQQPQKADLRAYLLAENPYSAAN